MIFFVGYLILIATLCYLLLCFNQNYSLLNKIKKMIKAPRNAQILIFQLQHLQSTNNINLSNVELVEFKFYTNLLKSIIALSRQYGHPLSKVIRQFISTLYYEEKFTKKLKDSVFSTLIQFLVISLITWLFIELLWQMVEIKIDSSVVLLIFSIQLSGVILFCLSTYFLYHKILSDFDRALFTIYSIKGLSQVGLSISKILALSKFEQFPKSNKFLFTYERLNQLTKQAITEGLAISKSIDDILEDLWLNQKHSFAKFRQILTINKFIFMAVFFLPSYLIVIFNLINNLGI